MKRLSLCFSISLAVLCSSCVKFKTETTVSYSKTEVTESSTADGKTRRTIHTSGFSGSNPKEVIESITEVYVKEELDQVDDQQALGRIAQLDPDGYFGVMVPAVSVKQCHFKRYCNYI